LRDRDGKLPESTHGLGAIPGLQPLFPDRSMREFGFRSSLCSARIWAYVVCSTLAAQAAPVPVPADPEWALESADGSGLRLSWSDAHPGARGGARILALAIPPGD